MITTTRITGDTGRTYTLTVAAGLAIGCTCPVVVYRRRVCQHISRHNTALIAAAAGPAHQATPSSIPAATSSIPAAFWDPPSAIDDVA